MGSSTGEQSGAFKLRDAEECVAVKTVEVQELRLKREELEAGRESKRDRRPQSACTPGTRPALRSEEALVRDNQRILEERVQLQDELSAMQAQAENPKRETSRLQGERKRDAAENKILMTKDALAIFKTALGDKASGGEFDPFASVIEDIRVKIELASKPVEEIEEEDTEVVDLYKGSFSLAYGTLTLLCDTKMHLKRNRFYGLLGPNQCGKTTLMRAIAPCPRSVAWRSMVRTTQENPRPSRSWSVSSCPLRVPSGRQ